MLHSDSYIQNAVFKKGIHITTTFSHISEELISDTIRFKKAYLHEQQIYMHWQTSRHIAKLSVTENNVKILGLLLFNQVNGEDAKKWVLVMRSF